MQFIIPINEAGAGESQTLHQVETGSNCPRTNKRKLRAYFKTMGVKDTEMKQVFREMGFNKKALTGVQSTTSEA